MRPRRLRIEGSLESSLPALAAQSILDQSHHSPRLLCALGQHRGIPSCESLPHGVSPDHQLIARLLKSDRDQLAVFLCTGRLSSAHPFHRLVTVATQMLARLLVMASAVTAPAGSKSHSGTHARADICV